MTSEPDWLRDERMDPAQLWEQRARDAASRILELESLLASVRQEKRKAEDRASLAVGASAWDAVLALSGVQWPGEAVEPRGSVNADEGDDGAWWMRFRVDGTSMKAFGIQVPGGYVVTGWR